MPIRSALFVVLLCAAWGVAPLVATAAPVVAAPANKMQDSVEGVFSYALPNGLKVLLVPEPAQPKVTVHIVYRVGSRHEGAGETGMAHLLEHMLFKGSPRHRDMLGELEQHGANFNAETDFDSTAYYETLLSTPENLRFALDLEADRMTAARIEQADLGKEFSVVRNELEIGENSPIEILHQRILRVAFSWHAYGRDIIGSRSDIENVPSDRLRTFYRQYYQPDNAVLIVAGRFDREPTLRVITSLFGRLPRPARRLLPTYTIEPVQDGERTVMLRRVGDVQIVALLYHGVPAAHLDFAAAEAAADVLAHQGSGRAYHALIESKLGSSLSADVLPRAEPGAVSLFLDVPKSQPIEPARDKLISVVENLAEKPITAAELGRFQRRARKDFARVSADPSELAADLGRWAAAGDWRLRYLHRDRIEALTPEAVRSFAQRYFVAANRTVGLYLPTEKPVRSPPSEPPNVAAMVKGYQGQPPPPPGEAFVASIDNIEARVQRLTLPSGMRVALLPKRSRGATVHIVLHVNAGTPQAARGKGGLLELLGPMLERGTHRQTYLQLSDELDRLGAEVRFPTPELLRVPSLGQNIEIETTREHLLEVLALLAELVSQPSFAKEQLELVRKELMTDLESALQEPLQLAGTSLLRQLFSYPADDPRYVPTLPERLTRLAAVRAEDLRQFHREYFGGGAAQLALVGDLDVPAVTRAIESAFGTWRAPRGYERLLLPYVPSVGSEETLRVSDKQNAVVIAAQSLEVGVEDPDYPALELFGSLLGGHENARLKLRLREQAGSSYTVQAQVSASPHDRRGLFIVFFTCAPQNAQPGLKLVEREIGELYERGPSAAELRLAQQSYQKGFDAELADDGALAVLLTAHLERDRTLRFQQEFLRKLVALTPAEVSAAVHRHIAPQRLVKVLAGQLP